MACPQSIRSAKAWTKFADLVGQKSGGKIKVRTYPASQLGSDTQMISVTQGGVQEIVAVLVCSASRRGLRSLIFLSFSPTRRKPTP